MVEVFKTNVNDRRHADMLLGQLHSLFTGYKVNFDLEDCDRILRIEYPGGDVQPAPVIDLLKGFGWRAEVLPD
jgi:hypothetical protein